MGRFDGGSGHGDFLGDRGGGWRSVLATLLGVSHGLCGFLGRLFISNLVPELCVYILGEESSRRIERSDSLDNLLSNQRSLIAGQRCVLLAVVVDQFTPPLVTGVLCDSGSSAAENIVCMWLDNAALRVRCSGC